ncbi:hypothetical protein [Immundisolibacter sp.]
MSIVYVTHEPYERTIDGVMCSRFNLTPAVQYGKIQVLIPAGASLISSVPTVRTLREKLRNFCDDDYLLPIGDPSIMMAAGAIAAEFNHGRIKVLRWDRKQRCYIPIQIDTSGKPL